ncbi:hypothetical protein G4G28_11655 [Massilia sp. Dwa41.01b]|nr:hypothetical protein G4G28_11655 [Massilia sp. Dwa41.01b]
MDDLSDLKLSRRDLLKSGAAAATSVALPGTAAGTAADAADAVPAASTPPPQHASARCGSTAAPTR